MPTYTTSDFARPRDDEEFQEIIRDLFSAHWKDDNTTIYGRSGQSQNGVDVYGHPNGSSLCFGVQCKIRNNSNLTKKDIQDEIKKARGFKEKLDTFIFATTTQRDTHTQKIIDDLSQIEQSNGSFKVQIRFWEDICSLLAEHPRLVDKHYKAWGYPQLVVNPSQQHSSEITENSPLLVGVVIDLSSSMLSSITKLNTRSISDINLLTALSILIERAKIYSKTPEGEEILPLLSLFLYGFGFGTLRKVTTNILRRILQVNSFKLVTELIPDDPIRDMFAETAFSKSLPHTPSLVDLSRNWEFYKKSVEWQIADGGLEKSLLYDALTIVQDRFIQELENLFFENPMLVIISNGEISNASDQDLYRVCRDIRKLGVHIVCLYLSPDVITEPKELYSSPNENWPQGAKRLFNCASITSSSNSILNEIVVIGKEKNWNIPDESRLFIQINQNDMMEEFIDIILSPLRKS
jgi:hypothetical protein